MLDQLIERSVAFDGHKQDFSPAPANNHTFQVAQNDKSRRELQIVTPPNLNGGDQRRMWQTAMPLTDWALEQVCGRLGPAVWPGSARTIPVEYMRACPPYLQQQQLNYWTRKLPEEREWFLRSYEDKCRAVLTNRYSTVDVTETLKWVKQILDEQNREPVSFHNTVLTPDVLHLRVGFKNVTVPKNGRQGGNYIIGTYITTGEVGNRRVGTYPYVQRTACTNSTVWQQEGAWHHVHTGNNRVLRQEFLVHMISALQGSEKLLAMMLDAENESLPKFDEVIKGICERQGWTESIENHILIGSESSETIWGAVNGMTFAAQKLDDQEAQADMELYAGEWLHHMMSTRVAVQR